MKMRSVVKTLLFSLVITTPILETGYATAQTVATVDPTVKYQTLQGWGVSLAWWAKVVGGYPTAARERIMHMMFDPKTGLGLNVVRYNIGGGENPEYRVGKEQWRFLPFRAAIPGYEPTSGQWDWSADENQRRILQEAISMGANQLEAFSNSPPWWMTISGSVTGSKISHEDNLSPQYYKAFADYLTEVVKHFHDDWGITFQTLEPFNEPTGDWRFGNSQEGCNFARPTQNIIIKDVAKALQTKELKTTIAASDEPSIENALATFDVYDSEALGDLSQINTHTYWGWSRFELQKKVYAAKKNLWMSEYGDGDPSGLRMAQEITNDMRDLRPTAWVYWQALDSVGGWGFIRNDMRNYTDTAYTVNNKYYVMGQYTRCIRPGFVFVDINSPNSIAAYSAKQKRLVIVTLNSKKKENTITYDLSKLRKASRKITAIRTTATEHWSPVRGITLKDGKFTVTEPAESVTTYIIQTQ